VFPPLLVLRGGPGESGGYTVALLSHLMQKCTEDRFLTFDFLEKESRGFGKAARHARESRKHTAGTLSVA